MDINKKQVFEHITEGILLVNKPRGITSHDVVDVIRRKLKMKRVGHAGTLDPLADGLLVVLLGMSTKLFSKFVAFDKEYLGILKLGEVTTTGDSEGEIIKKSDLHGIDETKLKTVFSSFLGEIDQTPPMVSALRVKGRRLYDLARRGVVVERNPRKVNIYALNILSVELPFVTFSVHCSKGTYVRKLAEDIGEVLGCGAHMTMIKRLSIGPFRLENAIDLEAVNESHIQKFTF